MDQKDDYEFLTETTAERRRYFTPSWFADLLAGRLSLGDTFWIGNFGTSLFFVPANVVLMVLAGLFLPQSWTMRLPGLVVLAQTVFFFALLRAVWITALPRTDAGIWRWLGVAVTLFIAVSTAFFAYLLLTYNLSLLSSPANAIMP